jgi:hypothetical protein
VGAGVFFYTAGFMFFQSVSAYANIAELCGVVALNIDK